MHVSFYMLKMNLFFSDENVNYNVEGTLTLIQKSREVKPKIVDTLELIL